MLKPGEITDLQLKCNAIVKEGDDAANGDLNAYRCVRADRSQEPEDKFYWRVFVACDPLILPVILILKF